MFTHSIRWRLQLWLGFLLTCVLSGFAFAVFELHKINQLRDIDDELERRLGMLTEVVRPKPPFGRPPDRPPFDFIGPPAPRGTNFEGRPFGPPPDFEGPRRGQGGREMRWHRRIQIPDELLGLIEQDRPDGYYFAVWAPDSFLMRSSTNAPAELPVPIQTHDSLTHVRMIGDWRESFHRTDQGDTILVGRSIAMEVRSTSRFGWVLFGAGLGVLALGMGGGWWLVSSAIRPVEVISSAAVRIADGNLAERIAVKESESELGRLAGVLNQTFARLEGAFSRQKQFTADASHELRTPLAVIISEAQTTLARERSAEEYRETVEACLESAQQMRRLTDSLLQLARCDSGPNLVAREEVDLGDQARQVIDRLNKVALEARVAVRADLQKTIVRANADHIQQVVGNLVSNAIYYNKPGGNVRVTTQSESGQAVLRVADSGQGISEADLPHIFERFYRADKARSLAQGRCGLGLAICKAILDASGGTITVESKLGEGTTFTVRFGMEARSSGQ